MGGPDGLPRGARLPLHRARPSRPRPLEPAVERPRHGYLRRRPRGARRDPRPEGRDPRRPLDRRRRGRALHRPPRHDARRAGRADRRRDAAHAENCRESRRLADGGVRPDPRQRARRPCAVLQGPDGALLRRGPAGGEGLARAARLLLAPGHAGRLQRGARLHQGLLGDGLHRGPEEDRRADARHPRRRRPDRADRCVGPARRQADQECASRGLQGRAARPLLDAQGPGQRRPPRIHSLVTSMSRCAALAAVLVVAACRSSPPPAPPPPKVKVVQPVVKEITEWDEYTARLDAVESVEVRPRVSGYLQSIHFQDGVLVKKGDLLFQIDPRPYDAALHRAAADVELAKSRQALAKKNFARAADLLKSHAISQEESDIRESNLRQAEASVEEAQSAVDAARLGGGFTRVSAAVAGRGPGPGRPASRRGDRQRPVAEVRGRGRRRQQGSVPHGEDRTAGRRPAGDPRGRQAGRMGRGGRSLADAARVPGRRAAMNISRFFIDRPIFAAVLSIVTLILGGIAYQSLPVAQYPEVVPPTIVVQASYPGAPPEVLADTVATPIEQEVNGVEDMLYMSSQSTTDGQMTLTITFRLGTDLDKAQVLTQNRVAIAQPRLPEDVRRLGVTTLKSSPDLLMVVHLLSPTKRYDQLYIGNFALIRVRDALRRLEGVGDVNLFGLREYSMRVWLDPGRLESRNIATSDVVQALREQNVQVASGAVGQQPVPTGHAFQLPVTTLGRLREPEEFENIVVKTGADGRITRVRDVARIELAARDYSVNSYLNNEPAVAMAIAQLPGSNALATADAVERTMEELSRGFPEGLAYRIVYNPTVFVRESINEVIHTLFAAVGLVVIVVLVFLQTWRASLIPLLAIPVSLVGTIAAMKAFGFSLNMLSLFGLVLAIGIVVDDAIVVVENVERHIAAGLGPRDAAHRAMDEVTGAVIAIAFGLSAVFVPTAFLGGITGQFYRQFALTIAVATILSAFNSLTLSPAMCALLLQPEGAEKDWFGRLWDRLLGGFFRVFNRVFERTSHRYGGAVGRLVHRPALALTTYALLLGLIVVGFRTIPTGFIPAQDKGYVIVAIQLPDGASLERTDAVVRRAGEVILATPGVQFAVAFAGFSGATRANSSDAGAIFVGPKSWDERRHGPTVNELIATLQRRLSEIEEASIFVIPPPPVQGLGTSGGFKLLVP